MPRTLSPWSASAAIGTVKNSSGVHTDERPAPHQSVTRSARSRTSHALLGIDPYPERRTVERKLRCIWSNDVKGITIRSGPREDGRRDGSGTGESFARTRCHLSQLTYERNGQLRAPADHSFKVLGGEHEGSGRVRT